jgi:hypothetical protein
MLADQSVMLADPPHRRFLAPGCSPFDDGVRIFGNVRTARFTAWNNKREELLAQGVKLTGVNATVAQDLEPEYTTLTEDGKTAFVSLQVREIDAIQWKHMSELLQVLIQQSSCLHHACVNFTQACCKLGVCCVRHVV